MSLRKEVLKPTIQLLADLGTLATKCFYHGLRGNCKQLTEDEKGNDEGGGEGKRQ